MEEFGVEKLTKRIIVWDYKVILTVNSNSISYSNISIVADNAAGYLK